MTLSKTMHSWESRVSQSLEQLGVKDFAQGPNDDIAANHAIWTDDLPNRRQS